MKGNIQVWIGNLFVRVCGVALIVAAIQFVFNADSRRQYNYLRGEVERMNNINRDLQYENERLRLQVDGLSGDDRYIEQIAREEFGMVAKGEVVYQLNGPTP